MAVMIEFAPSAFTTGPLAAYAANKEKIRWVLQSSVRAAPHIDVNVWFRDNYPQPPNSISVVVKGSHPSWFDTATEFNMLEYFEVRAQIANAIERGILQVRDTSGSAVTADDVRNGAVT
jgi:hypothetical protein